MTTKKVNYKKWYQKHKKSVLILGCFFLAVVIVYFGGRIYYNDKFLNGTKINGLDVSNMTVKEANNILSKNISKQSLILEFNDGNTETLQSSQLGISFNEKNSINKVMKSQNKWGWFLEIFSTENNLVDDIINIDDEGLNNGILTLEHAKEENQIAPVDAYIKFENGEFSIVKEDYGSKFNIENLIKGIKVALGSGKNKVNVDKVDGYEIPNIKEDDEDLNNKLNAANQYCKGKVTYTTASGEVLTLDGSTTINWLTKNDDGTYIRDDEVFKSNISDFVTTLASKMNTRGERRTFTGADGVSHTVSGGTYGFKVLQSDETEAILSLIKENQIEENRTPKSTGQLNGTNGGLGDTFVEVNITKQHLWFHKNGSVIMESDFVSGTETKSDRLTPSGAYYVYSKERNRVLRGTKQPDGTYEYESPVSYWMPFNKGIGFHDASWRSSFGGSIYLNNGSHGCINLPSGFAGQLYAQISVNTPVVVYR